MRAGHVVEGVAHLEGRAAERRCVHHEHAVDAGVGGEELERLGEAAPVGPQAEVDQVARRRPGGRRARPAPRGSARRARPARGRRRARASAAMASEPPALPTTATRRPRGQRLAEQEAGRVEQVGEASARGSRRSGGAARRRCGAPCPATAPASHAAFTATTGFARVSRRARRLKCRALPKLSMYMHDDVGGWVVLPVLEQVVARHVGAVAEGDERRDADALLAGPGHDRRADHAGLRQQRHPTRAAAPPGRTWRAAARSDRC